MTRACSELLILFTVGSLTSCQVSMQDNIALHPENPHYFLYKTKPTILITSGEHYGSVLNLDFDYETYLDQLHADGLNLTRTFTGAYVEPQGAFNIAHNTLAPGPGRFVCPWARSDEPGYTGGGNKFDLSRWDENYFRRLRDFVSAARERDIIVELALFCPFYEDDQWILSPMNANNNVNRLGNVLRNNVYTLDKNGGLLAVQESLVRKIIEELKDYGNVIYEICNEPYFGGVTLDWQHHIADIIVEDELRLGTRHLISQNIANGSAKIIDPHTAVSVFNFHYAAPPVAVAQNYHLHKVIGDNETGFCGTSDSTYRMEGWEFILAGGGLFNNLDYSFTAGHENGTFAYPPGQPGGGSEALRKQLGTLSRFMNSFDFVRMKPDTAVITGELPSHTHAHVLAEAGKQYAVYIFGARLTGLQLQLPPGSYQLTWLDPVSGENTETEKLEHHGGTAAIELPPYTYEVALRLVAEAVDGN
jgi:Cellulase (glycosyl hydrolase family 5)